MYEYRIEKFQIVYKYFPLQFFFSKNICWYPFRKSKAGSYWTRISLVILKRIRCLKISVILWSSDFLYCFLNQFALPNFPSNNYPLDLLIPPYFPEGIIKKEKNNFVARRFNVFHLPINITLPKAIWVHLFSWVDLTYFQGKYKKVTSLMESHYDLLFSLTLPTLIEVV